MLGQQWRERGNKSVRFFRTRHGSPTQHGATLHYGGKGGGRCVASRDVRFFRTRRTPWQDTMVVTMGHEVTVRDREGHAPANRRVAGHGATCVLHTRASHVARARRRVA